MAKRSIKKLCWSALLGNALLLQVGLLPDIGYAAGIVTDADSSKGTGSEGAIVLFLDVELNGTPRGIAQFSRRNGALWASEAVLRSLSFVLPAGTTDPVRLDGLAGVHTTYDGTHQRVTIMAPLSLLALPSTVLKVAGTEPQQATASPGALLNYDLYGTEILHGGASLSALTELRAFNRNDVLSSTALTQLTRDEAGQWHTDNTRLDTTWSRAYQDKLQSLRVGDVLTGSLPWTRATRIGGIQLSTNFGLQPYRVTAPLPTFLGSATLPSSLELYVNGLRQYSGQVPAGPFQLATLPNISGAGEAKVVLTDITGRATTLDFSLYASQQLLQKGLADWTVDLGAVRQNYGVHSFDYDRSPALSGTWRYGLTNDFTFETHAESSKGLVLAGVGGVWLLGQAGVLSGSIAHSSHGQQRGSQLGFGYSWRSDRFSFGVNATGVRNDYLDVAALSSTPPVSASGSATFGYNTQSIGYFGLNYLYLRYSGQPPTRIISASWFKALNRSTSLNVSLNQNIDNRRELSASFGVTMQLDGNISLSANIQHDQTGTSAEMDASSSVPAEGGVGWRAGARQGGGRVGGLAEVDFLGNYGRATAGVNILGDTGYAYTSASGGLVLMGGHAFATRRVDDAFAVVSTDGVAGVPVKLENRLIGETDDQGMLLVMPLRSYQNNQIAIDPMRLPADVRIERVNTLTTPSDRAGTLVHFGITPLRAASVILVDAAAKPVTLGSLVTLQGHPDGQPALVGFDGEVYLENLDAMNVLHVQTPQGACQVRFEFPKQTSGIPQLGPLQCDKEIEP